MMTHRIHHSGRGARLRRALALASLTLLVLGTLGCEDDGVSVPDPVASVQVSPPAASLVAGDSMTVQATVRAASGEPLSGRPVAWISSDTTVAFVRASGRVLARAAGTVTITAASGGHAGSATLTIRARPEPGPQGPVLSALVPAQAYQGSEGVAIILVGDGFDATATVLWNGSPRPTHRSGTREVQALIPDTDLQEPGAVEVRVAAGDGRRSEALTFTVVTRPPTAPNWLVIEPDPLLMTVGQAVTMTARYVDARGQTVPGAPRPVFGSGDGEVAGVTPQGRVTGLTAGETRVYAAGDGYATSAVVRVRAALDGPRVTYQSALQPVGAPAVDTIQWTDGSQPAVRAELVVRMARIVVDRSDRRYVQEFQAFVRGADGRILGTTGWMEHGTWAYDGTGGGYRFTPAGGAEPFHGVASGAGDLRVTQRVRNASAPEPWDYVSVPEPLG